MNPQSLPAHCFLCGDANCPKGFLDTHKVDDMFGVVYICVSCVEEMSDYIENPVMRLELDTKLNSVLQAVRDIQNVVQKQGDLIHGTYGRNVHTLELLGTALRGTLDSVRGELEAKRKHRASEHDEPDAEQASSEELGTASVDDPYGFGSSGGGKSRGNRRGA